jgi:hypothetical protein
MVSPRATTRNTKLARTHVLSKKRQGFCKHFVATHRNMAVGKHAVATRYGCEDGKQHDAIGGSR